MFNDCLPKFITAKTSFLAGLFAVEPMVQKKGPNLIESTVTQRQRLLTELNVKVKGGKFLKTTMVLLQWRVYQNDFLLINFVDNSNWPP